jgi:hopene-associated glycosyltransferase HpnB
VGKPPYNRAIGIALSALAFAAWLYLVIFRGRFWLVHDDSAPCGKAPPRSIAVIMPARNEAATIAHAVRSLLDQRYEGEIRLFVVDDHSDDETAGAAIEAAEAVERSSCVTVIPAAPLPPDWTGKLWALSQGVRIALASQPDYFLFTDADVVHARDSISALVARAERDRLDLASFMVRLNTGNLAEKLLMPAFVFFFLKLYPPAWIADPAARTAGAAGGCILVRPEAIERIGGLESIRAEIIDDCALARRVKQGGRIWMGLTTATRSIREYAGFGEIRSTIARTAFTQLNHSAALLAATVCGMGVLYVAPVALLFAGNKWTVDLGFFAYLIMMAAYWPMLRLYRRSILWAPLLPAVAAFYVLATIESALRYWHGAGGSWKGRNQDVPAVARNGNARKTS